MTELRIGGLEKRQFIDAINELQKAITPSLSDVGVDVDLYANKLYENAEYVSLVEGNKILGLASFYANDVIEKIAYLSFISISDNYLHKGWGRKMLSLCESISRNKGMVQFHLEVFKKNLDAIGFYQAMGYSSVYENQTSLFMTKDL